MPNFNTSFAIQLVKQGVLNLTNKRPLAMSLEIIHSCNCNCKHCDKGGIIPYEVLAPPERFGKLVREIKPLIAQISGGEPLLREDVFDVIKQIKNWGKLPYMVLVTNAWLLDEEKYLKLKDLGIDEISVSLDFPDERHDQNRGISGLYKHLSKLIPKLAEHDNHDITLISVIRNESVPELPQLAQHALDWNVSINFSPYSPLRTGDKTISVHDSDLLKLLRKQIDYLIQFKYETGRIFTAESTFHKYLKFFENGSYTANCRAGYRSLVVNPDGRLAPCAMQPYSFDTQKELIENFSKENTCGGCCVSMRANTEKSIIKFIADGVSAFRQMGKNSNNLERSDYLK
jgi:MoaA/NifB/PqqE/SkfB family radical SAM enzyme